MDEGMDIDAYFAAVDAERAESGPDLSPENVARAVRFMEQWGEFGKRSMGSAAAGDLDVLVAFAKTHLGSERIEPGVEAARRDDLARDLARLWDAAADWRELATALDRLAAAYIPQEDTQ